MKSKAHWALILASQTCLLSLHVKAQRVLSSDDDDDDSDTGKVVAWVIAIFFGVVLLALGLAYCICSHLQHEKVSENK